MDRLNPTFSHKNWFNFGPRVFTEVKKLLGGEPFQHVLEIGGFEGRSTLWMFEHLVADGGDLTTIDTWEGSPEFNHPDSHETQAIDMQEVEKHWDENVAAACAEMTRRSVFKLKGPSSHWLKRLAIGFDFIYIDGSHAAKDVLTDSVLAWQILEEGGVLAWDDYLFEPNGSGLLDNPRIAIDAFCTVFSQESFILHSDYMRVVRKIKRG